MKQNIKLSVPTHTVKDLWPLREGSAHTPLTMNSEWWGKWHSFRGHHFWTKKKKKKEEEKKQWTNRLPILQAISLWAQTFGGGSSRVATKPKEQEDFRSQIKWSTRLHLQPILITLVRRWPQFNVWPLIKHQRHVWQSTRGYLLTVNGTGGNPMLIFKWLAQWAASY